MYMLSALNLGVQLVNLHLACRWTWVPGRLHRELSRQMLHKVTILHARMQVSSSTIDLGVLHVMYQRPP